MLRRTFLHSLALSPMLSTTWKQGPPRQLETEIANWMEIGPVPGLVIGTLQDGKPGWVRAIGVRSIETKDPVTPDSIFQAASLSKQAITYAALALRKAGKLDFEKPLVSYVDDLPDERARTVTIRNVLSHTSGFPNWRSEAGQKLVPAFAPGTQFQYSGEGFFYLQRILEQVTGQGFAQLMESLVFQPLQMTSTSMLWKPEWTGRYALPHGRRGEPREHWDGSIKRLRAIAERKDQNITSWKYADYEAATREAGNPPLPNWMLPNAAASMITSAPDYARFLAAAIADPDIGKEQIRMRPALGWGLGWGIERTAGRVYLWQWGDNGGFKNIVFAEPASGNALFVFTNGDSGARVYDHIVTHATGQDHPALFWI